MYNALHFRSPFGIGMVPMPIANLSLILIQRRKIFIKSARGKAKEVKTGERKLGNNLDNFFHGETTRKFREEEAKYKKKLKDLKVLTRDIALRVKENEAKSFKPDSAVNYEEEKSFPDNGECFPSNTDEIKRVGTQASFHPDQHSLIVTAVSIPDSISKRLGLALKYLVSKKSQNWPLALQQLIEAGGFQGVSRRDVKQFINALPREQLSGLIPILDKMMQDSNISLSPSIINKYIDSLIMGPYVDDLTIQRVEKYRQLLVSMSKTSKLSRKTYELLVQAFGKNLNMHKVNECLMEMSEIGLHPSSETFNNILATCVYKTRDHSMAVDIFDSMKFLSQRTHPGTLAYQHVIVSHVNNDNIEKALDLYQEMTSERVAINQQILVALAKGCANSPALKMKSWDFIFDIYDNGWEPTLETFEYIMYLAAKSGDLALVRALYLKLSSTKSLTPRAFSFLMLAYSKSPLQSPTNELPVTTFHERGRIFRRNILSDVAFQPCTNSSSAPFLPVLDLEKKEEILAESRAIWTFTKMNYKGFCNIHNANSYLNVAATMGSLKEFRDRYESETYLDRKGLDVESDIVIEEPSDGSDGSNDSPSFEDSKNGRIISTNSLKSSKFSRSSLTYVIALKASSNAKDYTFAKRVWSERGLFRKTASFTTLSRNIKDRLDFQFASGMVSCLTKMNLLDDAAAILLSTEYQFRWTWKELKELYRGSVEIGNAQLCRAIRGIAKRAQINFEGKIRRAEFKRYVKQRGY